MQPKLPQYGSPLLAILRGGKEAVKPTSPTSPIPMPGASLFGTANSTQSYLKQPLPGGKLLLPTVAKTIVQDTAKDWAATAKTAAFGTTKAEIVPKGPLKLIYGDKPFSLQSQSEGLVTMFGGSKEAEQKYGPMAVGALTILDLLPGAGSLVHLVKSSKAIKNTKAAAILLKEVGVPKDISFSLGLEKKLVDVKSDEEAISLWKQVKDAMVPPDMSPAMRQGGYAFGMPDSIKKVSTKTTGVTATDEAKDAILQRFSDQIPVKDFGRQPNITGALPDNVKEDYISFLQKTKNPTQQDLNRGLELLRLDGRKVDDIAEMMAPVTKYGVDTRTQLQEIWNKATPTATRQATTPPKPPTMYPGLRKQGGYFGGAPEGGAPKVTGTKSERRIKIDADLKDIRQSLQRTDINAKQIDELSTKLAIMEDNIPDVSYIRRVAGKQLANGDTLSQVQATAQKIIAQNDFLKGISKTDAEQILQSPKSYTTREVEGARIVRRANLDDIVTQYGYRDLDEAGEAVNRFDRIKSEIASARETMRDAKVERALANKIKQVVTTSTAKRRDEVKFLKDQFMLTDSDVRKATGGRDFRTMSEGRFNDVVRNMEQIGIENADRMQAKAELMDLMERRNFQKVENYRKVQDFPPLSEMNAQQFREYAEALSKFQTDDVFLTQRQLEVVDRSSLQGVKTIREARERLLEHIRKMPGLENTSLADLNVTPAALDYVRYDTALAEKNPFYKYLVTRTHEHMLVGEAEFLTTQAKVLDLAKKANASRSKGIKQLFVPKHEEIIRYLEAPVEQKPTFAKALTKQELEYANFVSDYYSKAYDHLVMQKELYGSRYVDQYFTHIRRDFLEAWTDDGFVKAVKEWWQSQKDSLMVANIIDQDTGQILPKSKFFQYTMQRTGEITPSKNLTRVFLQYAKTFERKKMFDRMIPEMDIYVQSLTPTGLTKGGLETDRTLKKFVYQYINNKKGRTVPVTQLITQNNPVDIALRMGNTMVSTIDLGFSIIAQSAATVGEFVTTYQALGKLGLAKALKRRIWDTGLKRLADPNAAKILKDNEQFIGRNIWTELAETDVPLQVKFMQTMFAGFSQSTAEANKLFLLGNLTQAELKAGVISPQRLAQLRLDAGRWRDLGRDMKSIVGSTSIGAMTTKYKGWAIPIARTNIKNLDTLARTLAKGDIRKTITSKEIQETYRLVEMSTALVLMGSYIVAQDKDDSFVGRLRERVYMESMTLLGGIDPAMFASTPRLLSFIQQLTKNLKSIALLETYNTDGQWGKAGELKGLKGLQRQFTPSTIRQMTIPEGTGDPELNRILREQNAADTQKKGQADRVFKEIERLTPEQRRERLLELAETDPDLVNAVVNRIQNSTLTTDQKAIARLNNENKAKFVFGKVEKMPVDERRDYILSLLEAGVISDRVINRIAELAEERGIIEQ